MSTPSRPRARDLGIPFEGQPGQWNAITDVEGVTVGHTTLIDGDGWLKVGEGPVRTGVSAIFPRSEIFDPVFAAWYALNGNGEMTGTTWVEESGFLEGPIGLTNTHSVGTVHQAMIAWQEKSGCYDPIEEGIFWALPVVAETYDGALNDVNGFHVKPEHAWAALDNAASGPVAEGNVGGGTGMQCHEFKGGVGTSSRIAGDLGYTVGVYAQVNHGARKDLMIAGVPIGREIPDLLPEYHTPPKDPPGSGSIIVIVATDAPLLPHQLKRLAKRVPMGIARVGSTGSHYSGDIFLAFSTANPRAATRKGVQQLDMLPIDMMNPLFDATVHATEEAIVNALVAAETMVGINGNTAHALPHDRLRDVLRRYNRLVE